MESNQYAIELVTYLLVLVVYFYELIVYMILERNAFDSIAFFSQFSEIEKISIDFVVNTIEITILMNSIFCIKCGKAYFNARASRSRVKIRSARDTSDFFRSLYIDS